MNHPIPQDAALRKPLPAEFLAATKAIFGERLSTTQAQREHHGRDESAYDPMLPDAVVYPQTSDEVASLVRLCAHHEVPLIAYGLGSSLEGQTLALQGGISLDMGLMKKLVALNAEDLSVTVEAGMTRKELNGHLHDSGLFFPIDPGADASLGGMSATRASGTNAVRYGTMRENVLALTVVTADGKIIRTARRAKKSSAGYDLTRLFVGSEGTLGIITEVTVRLYPLPEAVSAAVCHFPSVDAAVRSVIQIMQLGIPVARVELMDAMGVKAVNLHSKLGLRETPLLLFEFHGSESGVREQAEAVQELAHEQGGMDFEWATRPEERSRLWTARHNFYFASLHLRPGSRSVTTDVCVPLSRLAECIHETNLDLAASGIISTLVGHVGDGNFHVQMMIDPNRPEERKAAEAINTRMAKRAIDMDGTCTGEHGVGLHKMDFLPYEHGEEVLDLMRSIKRSFDPKNILNPGKMIRLER